MGIHPQALVAAGAVLGERIEIGAFTLVGPEVVLGDDVRIGPHTVIGGAVSIGERCRIGAHCAIGGEPQIRGLVRPGALVLGPDNDLRDFVSLHLGGAEDRQTSLGQGNLLMAYCHVGHDCRLGAFNELANGVQLAGHVTLGDRVIVGGLAGVHQFVAVGDLAMIAGGAMVSKDVPPYSLVGGNRARLYGANREGLRRAGLSVTARAEVASALRMVMRATDAGKLADQLDQRESAEAAALAQFVRSSRRGICAPRG